MTNPVKEQLTSATSKWLSKKADKEAVAQGKYNKDVKAIFDQEFANNVGLAAATIKNNEAIRQLNEQYVLATQDVLNDKTLDFLIMHSNISAPTLTSIFAGFELAKKSRADKLNELRASDVDSIDRMNKSNERLVQDASKLGKEQVRELAQNRLSELRSIEQDTNRAISAETGDINYERRQDELATNRAIAERNRVEKNALTFACKK